MADQWATRAKDVLSDLKTKGLKEVRLPSKPKAYATGGTTDPAALDAEWDQWRQSANTANAPAEGYARGGASPDDVELQNRMKQILGENEQDPARAEAYMKAKQSYEMPTHERGAYSSRVLPMPAHDVTPTLTDIPGVTPKQAQQLSWKKFHQIAKGGTLFTLGGDRSNLGRLTHINNKELAWPVDLHAGTKYMTEPNKGAVWANAKTAASTLQGNIREAAKKGPVFGVFAPMGPTSVDSSRNMIDTLMAQIPNAGISKKDAKKFDDDLKNGLHVKGTDPVAVKKRERAKEIMQEWPGVLNAEKAASFAKKLSGEHRAAIVKYMEMAPFQNAGFPSVGMTRAAITDPDILGASGNLMGHHVVELHPGEYDPKDLAFEHSTYPVPTKGELVGKLPMVERHVAMPDYTEEQVMHPSLMKTGKPTIIHPYSPNPQGRSSYRGNTEMRQGIQPINERMLESIQERHGSDFAEGGAVDLNQYADHTPFGLYSHAAETAAALPQAKGTPEQFKGMLMKQGVKPAEIENSNYDTTFADRPSVTKDELVQHFRQSMPKLSETLFSKEPKYANYAKGPSRYHGYTIPGGENYREVVIKAPETDDPFKHGHWPDEENPVAHVRMSDRQGQNGEKILHVEELQSDWGQEGRSSGFMDPKKKKEYEDHVREYRALGDKADELATATEEKLGIKSPEYSQIVELFPEMEQISKRMNHLYMNEPDKPMGKPYHPYVASTGAWTDLALKKVLHEAAHGGYDKVVFTPGEEQASRFDLSNQIGGITAEPTKDGKVFLVASDIDDGSVVHQQVHDIDKLDEFIGKELADKIKKQIKFPRDREGYRIINKKSGHTSDTTNTLEAAQKSLDLFPKSLQPDLEIVPYKWREAGMGVNLSGLDLKVGGEGMKGFYDKIVPKQLNDIVKRHDPSVKMRHDTIDTERGPQPVHAIDITPKLRESILRGQRAFADGGKVKDYPLAEDHEDHLTYMSPDEFLDRSHPMKDDEEDKRVTQTFKKGIEEGHKLDPLALYPDGQENGRHRATAAKQLGIKKVPVHDYRKGKKKGGVVDRALMVISCKPKGSGDAR